MSGEVEEVGVLRKGREEVGLALNGVFPAAAAAAQPAHRSAVVVSVVVAPVCVVAAVGLLRKGQGRAWAYRLWVTLKKKGSQRVWVLTTTEDGEQASERAVNNRGSFCKTRAFSQPGRGRAVPKLKKCGCCYRR